MSTPHPQFPELRACLGILDWLSSQGAGYRKGNQPQEAQLTTSQMQLTAPMIADADLASIVKSMPVTGDLSRKWIYCVRGYGDPLVVPAVTAQWDFAQPSPYFQICVLLGSASASGAGALVLTAQLYRFETGAGNAHDYHHAQPTWKLRRTDPPLPGLPALLSEHTPAFPLDATGPVGVAMCAARAIHSSKGFAHLMQNPANNNLLTPYLPQMPAFAVSQIPQTVALGAPQATLQRRGGRNAWDRAWSKLIAVARKQR